MIKYESSLNLKIVETQFDLISDEKFAGLEFINRLMLVILKLSCKLVRLLDPSLVLLIVLNIVKRILV